MTSPVRFLETILDIMQQDEICVIGNALEMSATEAAKILTEICPDDTLVIRPSKTDEDLLVYRKHVADNPEMQDAIKTICGDKYAG